MYNNEQAQVICRAVQKSEVTQMQQLWETCFDDTAEFVQWYFSHYWKPQNTIGIFASEMLQASAQVIPYELRVRGTDLSCGYVVGVNTAPEARNRGYAKGLLLECLRMQRARGQAISLLMPFEGQFYYRYGWQFCYFHQRIITNPNELRCTAKSWGTVREVDLFVVQPTLAQVYDAFVQRYHGTVNRTAEQWHSQLEDAELEHSQCFIIEDEVQQVQGYYLLTSLEGKYYVREMAWCHAQAKAGMLYHLMQCMPEGDKLWLELPENDSLKYQLATSKTDVILYPFLMARIVDVKQCLELLRYEICDTELVLRVQDDFAQWNTGSYYMAICDGKAKVRLITKDEKKTLHASGVLAVDCTIDGLSQLVMGTECAETLMYQGLLQCEDMIQTKVIQLLQRLWPQQRNYINEYY